MYQFAWLMAMVGINIGWLPLRAVSSEGQAKLPIHLSRFDERKPDPIAVIARYAKMFTVEILIPNTNKAGSGVLLEKQGNVYTVLTAGHLLNEDSFTIKTADGKIHRVVANSVKLAKHGVDLGLLKFQSSNQYELVRIGSSSDLPIGSPIYAAGYPGETSVIKSGNFNLTKGEIITKTNGNFQGYSLVYSNITRPGMSGGPILNEEGELVAVHGQGEREDNGVKTGRNLGISIERFGLVALDMGVSENLPISTLSRNTSYQASEYLLKAEEENGQRNISGALELYTQAISIDPKFIKAYMNRAAVKRWNDIPGAVSDYSKVIAIDPKVADAYYFRGTLREKFLKQNNAAIQDFRQAAKLYRVQGNANGLNMQMTLAQLQKLGSSEK